MSTLLHRQLRRLSLTFNMTRQTRRLTNMSALIITYNDYPSPILGPNNRNRPQRSFNQENKSRSPINTTILIRRLTRHKNGQYSRIISRIITGNLSVEDLIALRNTRSPIARLNKPLINNALRRGARPITRILNRINLTSRALPRDNFNRESINQAKGRNPIRIRRYNYHIRIPVIPVVATR